MAAGSRKRRLGKVGAGRIARVVPAEPGPNAAQPPHSIWLRSRPGARRPVLHRREGRSPHPGAGGAPTESSSRAVMPGFPARLEPSGTRNSVAPWLRMVQVHHALWRSRWSWWLCETTTTSMGGRSASGTWQLEALGRTMCTGVPARLKIGRSALSPQLEPGGVAWPIQVTAGCMATWQCVGLDGSKVRRDDGRRGCCQAAWASRRGSPRSQRSKSLAAC